MRQPPLRTWAAVAGLFLLSLRPAPAELPAPLGDAVRAYAAGQSRKPLIAVQQEVERALPDPAARKAAAATLAAWLKDPATTPDARTFLCRQLALVGGAAEVPVLATLLQHPESADDARLALEVMETPEAGAALREALNHLRPPALSGAIQSVGARRDAHAVPVLERLIQHPDADTQAAAVWALGRIGTRAAAAALEASQAPGAAAALLACAERLAENGEAAEAVRRVESLLSRTPPPALRIAALATRVRVAPPTAGPAVRAAFDDADPQVRAAALQQAAAIPGSTWTAELAALLASGETDRQTALLDLLAARRDAAAREAVTACLASTNPPVRLAAIAALGPLGDARDVPTLIRLSADEAPAIRTAAERALAVLAAPGTDEAVARGIAEGMPETRALFIAAAAARGQSGVRPALHAALNHDATAVRLAAARALGRLGDADSCAQLAAALAREPAEAPRAELRRALVMLGRRLPDPAARAAPLLAALQTSGITPAATAALLAALADAGGAAGLDAVQSRLEDPEPVVREAAARALAAWPGPEALPALTRMVKNPAEPRTRAAALEGLLRLAPLAPPSEPVLAEIRPTLKDATERKAWLAALQQQTGLPALKLAAAELAAGGVEDEAAAAVTRIGTALAEREPDAVAEVVRPLAEASRDAPARQPLRELANRLSARQTDRARSETRRAALERETGAPVPVYLDAGPETQAQGRTGAGIRVTRGGSYVWPAGVAPGGAAAASVVYDNEEVVLELTGLDARRAYEVGFTWWDFDHGTRRQSVWAGGRKLLDAVALPNWNARQEPPAARRLALPGGVIADGRATLTFRREGEVNAVVSEVWLIDRGAAAAPPTPAAPPPAGAAEQRRLLLFTGRDHPAHDWKKTAPALKGLLEADPRLRVDVIDDPAQLGAADLKPYAAIVLHYMNWEQAGPDRAALARLKAHIEGGAGLVLVHFACGAFQDWPDFVKLAGRVWDPKLRPHDPHGAFRVEVLDRTHPVTAGLESFETTDELYTCLAGEPPVQMLATARSKVDQRDHPMAFTLRAGKGRVFHCVLGHDVPALTHPPAARLLRRGAAWSAGLTPE